jgi:GNAT superfamily N-acetyltransferase
MQSDIAITSLQESQIEAAGELMARAFFDDPVVVYMYPDENERKRLTPWHFTAFIRYTYFFGEVYTTSGTPLGTAVWFPPPLNTGEVEMTPERLEQAGLDKASEVLGAEPFQRFNRVCDYIEQFHPKEVPGPHWFLPLLGVNPPNQGQGVGRALLRPVLERADRDALPAYLWTAKARNVPFYQQQGFEVVTESVEPTSGIRFWTCRRMPPPLTT